MKAVAVVAAAAGLRNLADHPIIAAGRPTSAADQRSRLADRSNSADRPLAAVHNKELADSPAGLVPGIPVHPDIATVATTAAARMCARIVPLTNQCVRWRPAVASAALPDPNVPAGRAGPADRRVPVVQVESGLT